MSERRSRLLSSVSRNAVFSLPPIDAEFHAKVVINTGMAVGVISLVNKQYLWTQDLVRDGEKAAANADNRRTHTRHPRR